MEYPIYHRGKEVGTLRVAEDGLYLQLTAWCEPFGEGIQRLYGVEGFSSSPFGVLAPAGKGLQLHRRLSRHSCPGLPGSWEAGQEAEGFLPWRGVVEDQPVRDAMLRPDPEAALLALPADREPIPLAEYMPQMNPLTLNGREYLVLPLKDGAPAEITESV